MRIRNITPLRGASTPSHTTHCEVEYRALRNTKIGDREEAVKDLRKSFALDENRKEYWKGDSNLKTLRADQQIAARVPHALCLAIHCHKTTYGIRI